MKNTGSSEEEVFSYLSSVRDEDEPYDRILSSMCTRPHKVAIAAHMQFIETNLGDPGLFPGTMRLEDELIRLLGDLLHCPEAGGYATSGGTESNIQALRIAQKQKPVESPNVIIPASAHFSFDKACDMLGLEMRTVPLDSGYRMDTSAIPDCIDRNTVGIVAVVGTTEYGMIDAIGEICAIAEEADLFFHVDAAFGGLVAPFLPDSDPWDFSLSGVSSVSVDPHKMGMSTIPCGALLLRDPKAFGCLNVDTPYLTVKKECTLAGTRPGAPVAGAYAVLRYLGREGLSAIVSGCMENTWRLIEGMEAFGYPRAVTPDVNVATFDCPLTPAGWRVSRTRQGHMRTVLMPHVTRDVVEAFLETIGES
ncbi:MAG: tyrosine decarboxylase MfnA [Methanocalculus sp. MSAO_Arc1]|uniref:tyrosine decarboxylase MfnA n=1 Tax=Methanocalculus TaxID=71151 RepID=UPI000FEE4AD9|nr:MULTISPECIES: tyrosine decarboxylase MfnA [unclassified Methanocalculus]MCP1662936.1 tyrosine decarboxylase/aspartate 1-decarboxylase [Methanocalculus sp. AMF5]RQD82121.1 MAG: tyrosine decarboxylase MfnA [Methanocalculus sp. MSAO_Arc1]